MAFWANNNVARTTVNGCIFDTQVKKTNNICTISGFDGNNRDRDWSLCFVELGPAFNDCQARPEKRQRFASLAMTAAQ